MPGHYGGFTLPEVLIATFVSLMLITALMATVVQQRAAMRAQQLISEMHQNTRFAMDTVSRDLRMCGYGLSVAPPFLNDWIPWINNFDQNPLIVEGSGGGPDELVLVSAFDDPVAELASAASVDDTVITVNAVNGFDLADFNTYDSSVIFIGKSTTARITGVSGGVLTISIHHNRSMGLKFDYPAGTPVELVTTVRYEWYDGSEFPHYPFLARSDSARDYGVPWMRVSAGFIEDVQYQEVAGAWEISLTGIVAHPDRFYTHPVEGDHFRRETLTSIIQTRN